MPRTVRPQAPRAGRIIEARPKRGAYRVVFAHGKTRRVLMVSLHGPAGSCTCRYFGSLQSTKQQDLAYGEYHTCRHVLAVREYLLENIVTV